MDYLLPQSVTELGNCLFQLLATLVRTVHMLCIWTCAPTCTSLTLTCAAWLPFRLDGC